MSRFRKPIRPVSDAHVVVLCNYLRKHHALVFQEVAKHVGKLTILLSTEMEPDRNWTAEWGELDVRVQSNWMYTARWKHSNGFDEQNFIHIPIDTVKQLRQLKPDVVFSYEMGMRTALSGLFRLLRRRVPLVMVGNMSDYIETERGLARRTMRHFVRKRVDYATYNGPSCKRYLSRIGFDEDQLFHFPYCIDPEKAFKGEKRYSDDNHRRLIYSGALSIRKGMLPFTTALAEYISNNDSPSVTLSIAGGGELADEILALQHDGLSIEMLGQCDAAQLSDAYEAADVCVFPTLGDEWGLVPIEAMASGVPVLGSKLAQSVEAKVIDGQSGWVFDPMDSDSLHDAIARSMQTSTQDLQWMGQAARKAVEDTSAAHSAAKFCDILQFLSGNSDSPATSHGVSESATEAKAAV